MTPDDTVYYGKTTSLKPADETGSSNVEIPGAIPEGAQGTLHRQLKDRHIAMIRCVTFAFGIFRFRIRTFICSIGGVIGTGLFLGTANSLQASGPVGLLLGYLVVGTI
jgi:yeast amino acid transporter